MPNVLLIETLDLLGTLVFAISGGLAGTRRGADLFGVLVLAFVTAVAGGVMRDVLLGIVPPAALRNWHMLALSASGGLAAFYAEALVRRMRQSEQILDAAGLGVFAVTGTQKALDCGLSPVMAAVLGMVSGIGGGMMRDVLTARMPVVLHAEIYAVAALAAGLVVAAGERAGIGIEVTAFAGIALCLVLRLMAIRGGWNLPVARGRLRGPDE